MNRMLRGAVAVLAVLVSILVAANAGITIAVTEAAKESKVGSDGVLRPKGDNSSVVKIATLEDAISLYDLPRLDAKTLTAVTQRPFYITDRARLKEMMFTITSWVRPLNNPTSVEFKTAQGATIKLNSATVKVTETDAVTGNATVIASTTRSAPELGKAAPSAEELDRELLIAIPIVGAVAAPPKSICARCPKASADDSFTTGGSVASLDLSQPDPCKVGALVPLESVGRRLQPMAQQQHQPLEHHPLDASERAELADTRQENGRLRAENGRLREQLSRLAAPMAHPTMVHPTMARPTITPAEEETAPGWIGDLAPAVPAASATTPSTGRSPRDNAEDLLLRKTLEAAMPPPLMTGNAPEGGRRLSEDNVYMAKVAEQAKRYKEMVEYMKSYANAASGDLSPVERNLLSVAYKTVVGELRASLRIIGSIETKENEKGSDKGNLVGTYRTTKVEEELNTICEDILNLLEGKLISKAEGAEAKVFYLKMKADYYRYLAEFATEQKGEAYVIEANDAYKKATDAAAELAPTHPIRLGLALNYSVFQYEIEKKKEEACELAWKAFDDAIAELNTLDEDSYEVSTRIMQLLRDNLTLWTSDE